MRRTPSLLLLVCLLAACRAEAPPPPADAALSDLPGRQERLTPKELDYKLLRLEPTADGWDSEVANDAISARKKQLAKVLGAAGGVDRDALAECLVPGGRSSELLPQQRDTVFRGLLEVEKAAAPFPSAERLATDEALLGLLSVFDLAAPRRLELKPVHIEVEGDRAEVELRVHVFGASPRGQLQQNAVWDTTWALGDGSAPPRLESILAESFEQIHGPADGGPLFDDVTAHLFADEPAFGSQLALGQRHWGARIDRALGTDILGHQGLAVGDVNGDGREDFYLNQGTSLPNRLFLQQADGTVRDAAATAAVDYLNNSPSSLLLDLDNDGDQDLAVAVGQLLLHANDGHGSFTVEAVIPTSTVMSLAAADFDSDGDLDLYACRYNSTQDTAPRPFHDANNGKQNLLLRNDGNFRFTDVTAASGMDENNRRFSFAAAWEDFDNDGDQDLYVANDFGRNNLYRNQDGRFEDVAAELGVEDLSTGMSVDWSDFDRDGWMDLYVGNMFSSAGNRTTYQRRFQPRLSATVRGQFRRLARGNSLFRNTGAGGPVFEDRSLESGVNMGRWSWSSLFADLDNDGWQDLVVANGYVTNDDADDL